MAPVVRDGPERREVLSMRWGMPGPSNFGGQPITNIGNTDSGWWRRWLGPANRCVVPQPRAGARDPARNRLRLARSRSSNVLDEAMIRLSLLAATLLLASPAWAADIVGRASVIDGDTIDVHGTRIRFDSIDAPESRQLCQDGAGKRYRCA